MDDELLEIRAFLLEQAGDPDELRAHLLDIATLMRKFFAHGPEGVDADLSSSAHPDVAALRAVFRRALHLLAVLHTQDSQLATLLGRLRGEPLLVEAAEAFGRTLRFRYLDCVWPFHDGPLGEEVVTLGVADAPMTFVDFSRDGQFLLVGDESGVVQVRDAATGDLRHRLAVDFRRPTSANCLAFPESDRVAVGYSDGCVRMWDLGTGQLYPQVFQEHPTSFSGGLTEQGVIRLAVPPGSSFMLVGTGQESFARWDWRDGVQGFRMSVEAIVVFSGSFLPAALRGTFFAIANMFGEISVWNLADGRPMATLEIDGAPDRIAFADGLLVCRDTTGNIHAWSTPGFGYEGSVPGSTGNFVLDRTTGLVTFPVSEGMLQVGTDLRAGGPGRRSSPRDSRVPRWMRSGIRSVSERLQLDRSRPTEPYVSCCSGKELDWFATTSTHETTRLDAVSRHHEVRLFDRFGALRFHGTAPDGCVAVLVDPAETWLATVSGPGDLNIWAIDAPGPARVIRNSGASGSAIHESVVDEQLNANGVYRNDDRRVTAGVVSSRGAVAIGDRSGRVRLVSPSAGPLAPPTTAHGGDPMGSVTRCVVGPGGNWVAMVGPQRVVHVRGIAGDRRSLHLDAGRTGVFSQAATVHTVVVVDEDLVAGVDDDGTVTVWSTVDGAVRCRIEDGASELLCGGNGHGRRWVATGGRDGRLTIWDADRGRVRFRLAGHRSNLRSAATTSDHRVLVTVDDNGDGRMWDVERGIALGFLNGRPDAGVPLVVDPRGRWVAAAELNGPWAFWSAAQGTRLGSLRSSAGIVCVAAAPLEALLLTADSAGRVESWSAPTGEKVGDLGVLPRPPAALAVSGSGRWLSAVDRTGVVHVIDLGAGEIVPPIAVDGALADCCWVGPDLLCAGGLGGGYLFRVTSAPTTS